MQLYGLQFTIVCITGCKSMDYSLRLYEIQPAIVSLVTLTLMTNPQENRELSGCHATSGIKPLRVFWVPEIPTAQSAQFSN